MGLRRGEGEARIRLTAPPAYTSWGPCTSPNTRQRSVLARAPLIQAATASHRARLPAPFQPTPAPAPPFSPPRVLHPVPPSSGATLTTTPFACSGPRISPPHTPAAGPCTPATSCFLRNEVEHSKSKKPGRTLGDISHQHRKHRLITARHWVESAPLRWADGASVPGPAWPLPVEAILAWAVRLASRQTFL